MSRNARSSTEGLFAYFALACAFTWLAALPVALAYMQKAPPPPFAVAGAGLSAFGPLLAAIAVASRQRRLGEVFNRWRTNPAWVVLALTAPLTIHLIATSLFVAIGGRPPQWFYPPSAPEQVAALVVFPLGEEFGWRGFAHPRVVERFGLVKGSLVLGAVWGVWHLMYSINPESGRFDWFLFGLLLAELPLYSVLIACVFERANRSMAVAIGFHAGAHLDHFEHGPRDLRLHALHLCVVAVVAFVAARLLRPEHQSARAQSA